MEKLARTPTPTRATRPVTPLLEGAAATASARVVPFALAAFLAVGAATHAPDALAAQQPDPREDYLRAAAEHFRFGSQEVAVLARWGLSDGEIPVVLFLAREADVSPDVVVAQRRRGGSWMEVATSYAIHAGSFHVPLGDAPGFLAQAYEHFGAVEASQWSTVPLSDAEVVGLVNVRFLSRHLGVPPERAARDLGGGDVVEGYRRLRDGQR